MAHLLTKQSTSELFRSLGDLNRNLYPYHEGDEMLDTIGLSDTMRQAFNSFRAAQSALYRLMALPEGYTLARANGSENSARGGSGRWILRYFRRGNDENQGAISEYRLNDLCSKFLDEYQQHGVSRWPKVVRAIRAQMARSFDDLNPDVIPLPSVLAPAFGECSSCEESGRLAIADDRQTSLCESCCFADHTDYDALAERAYFSSGN